MLKSMSFSNELIEDKIEATIEIYNGSMLAESLKGYFCKPGD